MAKRGSNKRRSQDQELHIAALYEGRVSPSSGASPVDAGDVRVRTSEELFECKTTGGSEKPARSTLVKQMEKITDEAWAEGYEPILCLRFFMPDSLLADQNGFVDLSVRLSADDAARALALRRREDCTIDGKPRPW